MNINQFLVFLSLGILITNWFILGARPFRKREITPSKEIIKIILTVANGAIMIFLLINWIVWVAK